MISGTAVLFVVLAAFSRVLFEKRLFPVGMNLGAIG
jgi:hypothetical protein